MSTTQASLPAPSAARLARPRWLDVRLMVGVVLILVSVVGGARVVGAAERSTATWTATRELAAGSVVTSGDLRVTRVRLGATADTYLPGSRPAPVGAVLSRTLAAGELVPRAALGGSERALVTVPVEAGHLPPDLRAGQRVDVYVTERTTGAAAGDGASGPPERVLAGAAVASVERDGAGLGGGTVRTAVILSLARESARDAAAVADVPRLIAAFQRGDVDLVRLARGTTR